MPTSQQREHRQDMEQHEREALSTLIGEQVFHSLGEPNSPHKVQVRPLWKDHYRVNVFVGADAASTTVAHSFFLVADGDGNIKTSTPKIRKVY